MRTKFERTYDKFWGNMGYYFLVFGIILFIYLLLSDYFSNTSLRPANFPYLIVYFNIVFGLWIVGFFRALGDIKVPDGLAIIVDINEVPIESQAQYLRDKLTLLHRDIVFSHLPDETLDKVNSLHDKAVILCKYQCYGACWVVITEIEKCMAKNSRSPSGSVQETHNPSSGNLGSNPFKPHVLGFLLQGPPD